MISPMMPTVPQTPQEDTTLASGGMVTRPLPKNSPDVVETPAPIGGAISPPKMPPRPVGQSPQGPMAMAMPSIPAPPPNPKAEKLRQRVGAKQFFLQQLGIDWTPDEEDLRREHDEMPDGDDIVRYSVPEDVAVERKPEEKKEKKEKKDELELDFEPFSPETEDDEWVEVGAINKGQQSNVAGVNSPLKYEPKPLSTPRPVVPPQEVTASIGTASV